MARMHRPGPGHRASVRRRLPVHPLAGAILLALPALAQAQVAPGTLPTPMGETAVVAGDASHATVGNTMTVTQRSNRAILNWFDFSIGEDASVHFDQPTNGIALNRVLGENQSEIWGTLTATGRVFLVNPNGVLFGAGSRVEVGGLVATVLDTDTDAFMNEGNNVFTFFALDGSFADIRNYGTLIANPGGTIALLGNEVENGAGGVISTEQGSTLLAAADGVTLDFFGDRLTQVSFSAGTDDGTVENYGLIEADGGSVELHARSLDGELGDYALVRHLGTIRANTLLNVAGRIVLDAGAGEVHVGPVGLRTGGPATLIEATGLNAGETGGEIEIRGGSGVYVLGQRYQETGGATVERPVTIDASGAAGGGSILLHSSTIIGVAGSDEVADDTLPELVTLRADATQSGRGGGITLQNEGIGFDVTEPMTLVMGRVLLSARGDGSATGGQIELTGTSGQIVVARDPAMIEAGGDGPGPLFDASGASGGGLVSIASDAEVGIDDGVTLRADATGDGDGGEVYVYGGAGLYAYGLLSARGAGAGNGGAIETSAAAGMDLRGIAVDAGAANGVAGSWLIDPYDVFIVHGEEEGGVVIDGSPIFEPLTDTYLQDADINAALDAGTSITITTGSPGVGDSEGDITFLTDLDTGPVEIRRTTGDGEVNLQFNAYGSILAEDGLVIDGGDGVFNVGFAAGVGSEAETGSVELSGALIALAQGSVEVSAANVASLAATTITTGQGDVFVDAINSVAIDDSVIVVDEGEAGFSSQFGTYLANTVVDVGQGGLSLHADGDFVNIWQSALNVEDGSIDVSGVGVFIDESQLAATAGAVSIEGTGYGTHLTGSAVSAGGDIDLLGRFTMSSDADDAGVSVGGSTIFSDGGDITIVGVATDGFGSIRTGVRLSGANVSSPGGTVDIRGFAGGDFDYIGQATGVFVGNGTQVGSADTARVRIVGEVAGADGIPRTGISLGDETAEAGCGNFTCTIAGERIILQAAADGAESTPIYLEAGAVDIVGGDLVNLRPGGVDGDGAVREIPDQAISVLGAEGFAIGQALLDAIDTPNLVIGSDVHAGPITVDADLEYDGNLTLQSGAASEAGIVINASIDVGANTLALVSGGDISKPFENDLLVAESLLAISTGGDVFLPYSDVEVPTLAGSAAGDFHYVDIDDLTIGTVTAVGVSATDGQSQVLTATGVSAGGDVFIRNLEGDMTLLAGVTAGGNLTLVTAGTLQNAGGAALTAGGRWQVWASTWEGEARGGLAGGGPLPNLYNCSFEGACGVTVSGTDNQFIYAAQPTAVVTIGDYAREYGLENPAFGFEVAGLVLGDLADNVIVGTPTTTATIGSNVGQYAIDGTFTSPAGYAIQYVPGALTITPATLLLVANPFSRIYGDPEGTLTGTVTGFRNEDTLESATSGTLVFTSGTTATTGVGTYAITGGGLEAGNYVFVQGEGNATAYQITPATLVYVANPFSRLFGLDNGVLTGTVTGFRNGETIDSATTGTLLFSSPAGRDALPGQYAIDGSGLGAANYVFVQAPENATALTVAGIPTYSPPVLVGKPYNDDEWPVDPNFGPAPMCPVVAATMFASQTREDDVLAREWSRVRATPNVTNCLQSEHGRGCDDF